MSDMGQMQPIESRTTSEWRNRQLPLLRSAATTLAARLLGPLSAFALTLLLARTLGAEESGLFFTALTLMTLFATLAKLGMETALQRHIGSAHGCDKPSRVIGLYRQSVLLVMGMSFGLALLFAALAPLLSTHLFNNTGTLKLLLLMSVCLIPFSLLGVHAAVLKAIGKPAWGSFFEAAAWPCLSLALVVLSGNPTGLDMPSLALVYLVGAIVAMFTAYRVLRRELPQPAKVDPLPTKQLLRYSLPLCGVELGNYALIWTPFLLLPIFSDATDAGLYNVSYRLASQLGLLLTVFAAIGAPRFAALHDQGDLPGITRLARQLTRAMFLIGLIPGLALLLLAEPILELFGDDFTAAAPLLQILIIGQLIRLAVGPVGYLLAMTGQERLLRNITFASLLLMTLLSLLLIPELGATGAAISSLVTIAVQCLACCLAMTRKLQQPPFFLFTTRYAT